MILYNNIQGLPISEIDIIRTSTSADVLSNDLFLISLLVLSNVSPFRTYSSHGYTYTNEYRSLNTSYSTLSDRIFNDICSLYGIKNMAWESSAEYSLANHIHNYSNVKMSAYMTPATVGEYSIDERKYVNLSTIATFSIDTKNYTIAMPRIRMYSEPDPYIGQLKFFIRNEFKTIDTNAGDFDGWTYPNGASLSKSRFPLAYEVFGTSYGGDDTHFNIPNLSNFLKPITIEFTKDLRSKIPYKMPLLNHAHKVSYTNLNIEASVSMKYFSINGNTDRGTCCHGSKESTPNMWDTHEIGFKFKNFKINNLNCVNTSGENGEYEIYPAFNYIPTLIYIGKPYYGD